MECAMTGQENLNADTDKARSSNRDCKGELAQIRKKRKALPDKDKKRSSLRIKKGKSTSRQRNINSSTTPGEERCSAAAISTGMLPRDVII
jgi:hypothetical protein